MGYSCNMCGCVLWFVELLLQGMLWNSLQHVVRRFGALLHGDLQARRVGARRDPHEKMAELATRDGWAILQPTGADASLELLGDWCRRRRASLHAALFSESALLLRGWDQTPQ